MKYIIFLFIAIFLFSSCNGDPILSESERERLHDEFYSNVMKTTFDDTGTDDNPTTNYSVIHYANSAKYYGAAQIKYEFQLPDYTHVEEQGRVYFDVTGNAMIYPVPRKDDAQYIELGGVNDGHFHACMLVLDTRSIYEGDYGTIELYCEFYLEDGTKIQTANRSIDYYGVKEGVIFGPSLHFLLVDYYNYLLSIGDITRDQYEFLGSLRSRYRVDIDMGSYRYDLNMLLSEYDKIEEEGTYRWWH